MGLQAPASEGSRDSLRAPYPGLTSTEWTVREQQKRFRFPRSARLTRTSEFRQVKSAGRSFTGRYLVLAAFRPVVEASETGASVRVGLVTSRRVGPAVARNLVRRRLREVYRLNQARISAGWWLVIIARVSASSASVQQLEQDWLRLAKRASILAPD